MNARRLTAFCLLLAISILGGCGGSDMDGGRGGWTGNNKQNQSNSFVGFGCTATASPHFAASGEPVTISVTAYNAAGTVSVPGFASTPTASGVAFSTAFTNSGGEDVLVSRSVKVSDGTSQTSCTFSLIVKGQPGRVL